MKARFLISMIGLGLVLAGCADDIRLYEGFESGGRVYCLEQSGTSLRTGALTPES